MRGVDVTGNDFIVDELTDDLAIVVVAVGDLMVPLIEATTVDLVVVETDDDGV